MAKNNPYSVIASQRANYYVKGSPVQFVLSELLREESTGDILVTLSFKNILERVLTYCKIHFVCKNPMGQIIAQEDFVYENISVREGEIFGSDDAVFVSSEQVASVENTILEISFDSSRVYDISQNEIIRLPELRKLSEMMVGVIGTTLNSGEVRYRPVQLSEGWQCTCGAFNYNTGRGVAACGECGQDKAMLFSALRSAEAPANEGTRVFSAVNAKPSAPIGETRAFTAPAASGVQRTKKAPLRYSIMSDATADFINKFVPLIALGASAVFVIGAFILKQIIL